MAENNNITACVITVSDRSARGEREVTGGPAIAEALGRIGVKVEHTLTVPDEREEISRKLLEYSEKADIVITTGGTGLSPRDVTPEATLDVVDRTIPGMAEAMRADGLRMTRRAMLSRAVCGVRGSAIIINLPGSPKGALEGLEAIAGVLVHAVEKIKGSTEDCAS